MIGHGKHGISRNQSARRHWRLAVTSLVLVAGIVWVTNHFTDEDPPDSALFAGERPDEPQLTAAEQAAWEAESRACMKKAVNLPRLYSVDMKYAIGCGSLIRGSKTDEWRVFAEDFDTLIALWEARLAGNPAYARTEVLLPGGANGTIRGDPEALRCLRIIARWQLELEWDYAGEFRRIEGMGDGSGFHYAVFRLNFAEDSESLAQARKLLEDEVTPEAKIIRLHRRRGNFIHQAIESFTKYPSINADYPAYVGLFHPSAPDALTGMARVKVLALNFKPNATLNMGLRLRDETERAFDALEQGRVVGSPLRRFCEETGAWYNYLRYNAGGRVMIAQEYPFGDGFDDCLNDMNRRRMQEIRRRVMLYALDHGGRLPASLKDAGVSEELGYDPVSRGPLKYDPVKGVLEDGRGEKVFIVAPRAATSGRP